MIWAYQILLTTLKHVATRSALIAKVTDLPTIVDADIGFKNCKETILNLEEKGLSGCHIEDQIEEKDVVILTIKNSYQKTLW